MTNLLKYRKDLTPSQRKMLIAQNEKESKYAMYILNESPTALSKIEWLISNLSNSAQVQLHQEIKNL
tara:strand:+ start:876 stop:1076 length:201 start_codon:yes stop_codon:yes gene_type:complete